MKHVSKIRIIEIKKELYRRHKPITSSSYINDEVKPAALKTRVRRDKKIRFTKHNKEIAKNNRKAKLTKFAIELNANLPRSEKWFWKHYQRFSVPKDIKNGPWGYYIFDIINHEYRYAIEVDGKSHEQE